MFTLQFIKQLRLPFQGEIMEIEINDILYSYLFKDPPQVLAHYHHHAVQVALPVLHVHIQAPHLVHTPQGLILTFIREMFQK